MNDISSKIELQNKPEFVDVVRLFGKIGLISFGGPAGQIALMHNEIVDNKKWLSEEDYLHALNFCHLLPGPEAQQLATYIGWRLYGLRGGLACGLLFILPGVFIILALSILYAYAANLGWFSAIFVGIKAAVLAVVIQPLIRISKRALDAKIKYAISILTFIALFFFKIPFPLIIIFAGLSGYIIAKYYPKLLNLKIASASIDQEKHDWKKTIFTVLSWLLIWGAPIGITLAYFGSDSVFWDIGIFFSKLAIVTFGGAYAVLAYMAQASVEQFSWLNAKEMADGLGLAETTPGPLILVTQFVGFLAAFRANTGLNPLFAGILGAGLTTWVTFAPCFLWIFSFAPFIERLRNATYLKAALSTITAAVVGVIANLSIWFGLHVLFDKINKVNLGFLRFDFPQISSYNIVEIGLFALSCLLIFKFKFSVMRVLGIISMFALVLVFGIKIV